MKVLSKIVLDVFLLIVLLLVAMVMSAALSPTNPAHQANLADHLWFLMVVPLQPAVWLKGESCKSWRFWGFLSGSVVGLFVYFLIEFVAGWLLVSGNASFGLALGIMSDLPAALVAFLVTRYVLKRRIQPITMLNSDASPVDMPVN